MSPRTLTFCRLLAGQMHLDAVALAVVEGVVLEACEIEIAAEFAVDAREQVEIELRGDAGGIVVGGVEHFGVLHQVDADDQRRAAPEHARGMAQERRRLVRLEIADGRAREKADARGRGLRRAPADANGLREIGGDRQHREPRIVAAQLGRLAASSISPEMSTGT